jgi:hypothetical protein
VPGTPDERLTAAIFLRAGRFPDDQPLRLAVSDAEHALSSGLVKGALSTPIDLGPQSLPGGGHVGL